MSMGRPLDFDPLAEAQRQWLEHGWGQPVRMTAATALMRAQQIVLQRVDAALRPLGLTFARYEALTLLHFSRRGSLPLGKMGARLMVHPASVTNAVDRLEAEGLVRRIPHPTDRRATLAEITEKGRSLVAKSTEALVAIEFGLAEFTEPEAGEVASLITALRARAGDYTAPGD